MYVLVDRLVLHAVEHRLEPTHESVETNAIDPHRDIPVRRIVTSGEQTITQERVQVRIDELNVELFTPQFVEENVDVMVDIPVLPQTMRYSVDVELVLNYPDLFSLCWQGDEFQNFETRWDQALLPTSQKPKDNVWERSHQTQMRKSDQLRTVLAMHEQEIHQNRSRPSCQKFKPW